MNDLILEEVYPMGKFLFDMIPYPSKLSLPCKALPSTG